MNKQVLYAGIFLIPILVLSLVLWLISKSTEDDEGSKSQPKTSANVSAKSLGGPGVTGAPTKTIEAPLSREVSGIPPMPAEPPPMPDVPPPMPAMPPPMPDTPTAMPMMAPPMPHQEMAPAKKSKH